MFYLFIILSLATSSITILLSSLLFCCNCKRSEKSESHLPPPLTASLESGRWSKQEKHIDGRRIVGEKPEKSRPVATVEKKSQVQEQKSQEPSQESKESKEVKPKQTTVPPDTQPKQPAAPVGPPGGDEGYEACPDMTPEQLAKALENMK